MGKMVIKKLDASITTNLCIHISYQRLKDMFMATETLFYTCTVFEWIIYIPRYIYIFNMYKCTLHWISMNWWTFVKKQEITPPLMDPVVANLFLTSSNTLFSRVGKIDKRTWLVCDNWFSVCFFRNYQLWEYMYT